MDGFDAEEVNDVRLKTGKPSTKPDLGYSSFQNGSQHIADSPTSLSFLSTENGGVQNGLLRQNQLDSGVGSTLRGCVKGKSVASCQLAVPILGTPLSRSAQVVGFNRSTTTSCIRPRALTCTSTPCSSSLSFYRRRHISLESSSNCDNESISSFDSAYSSCVSDSLPSTTLSSVLDSNVPEQNSSKVQFLREGDQKGPLQGEVVDALPPEQSALQSEQELRCPGKMLFSKFLSMSSPNVSRNFFSHSPQLKKKEYCSNNTHNLVTCSTPNVLSFNEQFPVSKSSLDISGDQDLESNDLLVQQDAKQPRLSQSSPDITPPNCLFSSSSFISGKVENLIKDCSCIIRDEVPNVDNTENFVPSPKLETCFDEAYIPRAVTLDWDETFDLVKEHTAKKNPHSVAEVVKVKRKLALDLGKNPMSIDKQTVEAELTKHQLSQDENKEGKSTQASSAECDPSLEQKACLCSQAEKSIEVLNMHCSSLNCIRKCSRHKNLPSWNVQLDISNSVEAASTMEIHVNQSCTSKTPSASVLTPTENSCSGRPTFEFVHWLARKESEQFRSSTILLLLLDRAPYVLPNVLGHLSPEDVLSFSQVNKQCRRIVVQSKPLALKVRNLRQSRLAAVSAVGKENLVYRHKNYHSDPGITRRVLGEVNVPVRSHCALFEPPARRQLKQTCDDAGAFLHFIDDTPFPQSSPALPRGNKAVCDSQLIYRNNGSHNLQVPCLEDSSPNSEFQDDKNYSRNVNSQRMFASDPYLYVSQDHTYSQKSTTLIHDALQKRDNFCVPSAVENKKIKKLTVSRKFSMQSCIAKSEGKSEKLPGSPRKILGAIQSAVSSIQAAVSPRKTALRELPPSKEKKSSRLLNFECDINNKEHKSSERSSSSSSRLSSSRLQKCNMLNHANKAMSQQSGLSDVSNGRPLQKSNSEGNPEHLSSLHHLESKHTSCIEPDPSPIKCPPKKLALFSKAARKQLRRL